MKTNTPPTMVPASRNLAAVIPLPEVLRFRCRRIWDGASWAIETQAALQGSEHPLATEVYPEGYTELLAPCIDEEDDRRQTSQEGFTYRPAGVGGNWGNWMLLNKRSQKPTELRDLPALLRYYNVVF